MRLRFALPGSPSPSWLVTIDEGEVLIGSGFSTQSQLGMGMALQRLGESLAWRVRSGD